MRWLALHLPLLPLEACCATLPAAEAARPVVLVAQHRVHSANAAAAACGIRPGMKRATALALAADLRVAEARPARDTAALRAVAHVALAFTPSVALHDTQTVLLEVQPSLRLFGGLAALCGQLSAAVAPLGHRVQMAAAPTALGAALLAQWFPCRPGPGLGDALALVTGPHTTDAAALQTLLDGAPLALLGPGREHDEALQGMGLHTVADLRGLPRDGLARRFGPELLDELDRALGRRADPRRWLTLPARFDSRLELAFRADTAEQVLQGAHLLLARLVAWAQAARARVGAFTLRMRHERQRQAVLPATELHIALAEPALDVVHLQLLLRERLAHVVLAAPTLELQITCSHLVAGAAPNGELFPTRASAAEGLTRLLERLRARLGDEQVQRLVAVADHRPERATCTVPAQSQAVDGCPAGLAGAGRARHGDAAGRVSAAPGAPAVGTLATHPLHRPAWLLPDPLPLAERDTLPLLQGRPLQLLSGPERIETGWWDGEPAARDYYIAQAEDGSLVWIWRSRVPQAPGEVQWFLQGRFG